MKKAALDAAATKENLADIVNSTIDELIKSKFELPSFKRLLRLARAARTVVSQSHYEKIVNHLTKEQKKEIDNMIGLIELEPLEDNIENKDKVKELFSWARLKMEPKKPTSNNVKNYITYVNQLKSIRQYFDIDIDFILPARLETLKEEAFIADIDDMQAMRPLKRYALAVILIAMKSTSAIDDLVQIFITWIKGIESHAKNKLEEYRLNQSEKTDGYILLLYKVLLALKNNPADKDKIEAIEVALGNNIDKLAEECREYLGLTEETHLPWMLKPYTNKRNHLFNLLENLTICSTTQDKAMETALKFVMYHRHSHKEWIHLNDQAAIQPDLDLLSEGWFKVVTGCKKEKNVTITKVHRHYYEIALFTILMSDLNCGDAYVDGAGVFDNPNKQFVSWEEFNEEVDSYCAIHDLPTGKEAFTASLKQKLRETAKQVDKDYPANPNLIVENGMPILKKLLKKKEHPELDKVRQMIMDEIPLKSIVDAIIDVENWLRLSNHFKPLSGYETKITDYPSRFVATALAYGCNLGPTQTERSLLKFSRKQIAWLFNHHVTDTRLIKAVKKIINQYHVFTLPKHWGPGDSLSVDGTFWDMYTQNLLAAHHIRYGTYGGVGYYHVSDQYIALFSNFISCGAHESIYLLDGIVENDSDIQAKKVHGDSWAQSEVLFGLASLMGVAIMPRIKQFKNLYYYKASTTDNYENIDALFTNKPIDWELIETHYHDMLRVVLSIQKGKIKASTILRKLCSKSRKNKLYYAFRELGRVQRTLFLLNYINDPQLRRTIQAATCKSEEFNQFIGWICFGGNGVISDNLRANQRKIIRFNHLLANMLIFHNVVYQTKGINKLRNQGIDIPDEILASLSPYWTEHFNRFGIFQLDMDYNKTEIEYNLVA